MTTNPWVWGWEALAAIGTLLATVVALGIAMAGAVSNYRSRKAQARLAMFALWPHLHSARGSLFRLQMKLGPDTDITTEVQRDLGADCAQLLATVGHIESIGVRLSRKEAGKTASMGALCRHIGLQVERLAKLPTYPLLVMTIVAMRDTLLTDIASALRMAEAAVDVSEKAVAAETGRPLPHYENELTEGLDEP